MLTEKSKRWNRFIDEICSKDLNELSEIQRAAVLCFWYDAEMQSGGHSGYFDCYPEIKPEELIAAINLIGYKEISDNYQKALDEQARDDGYETVDNVYYDFEPSLCDLLMEFVEKNKDEILR
ncbi:MAG: DMP19 family protein [Ruminococcaceae bacterium]|nr:DMP19 family protein [Oscillospiraceae bacterium]